MIVLWASPLDLALDRPILFVMVYMMVLLVAVTSVCVTLLAACNLAIHRAFSAGYKSAQATLDPLVQLEAADARARQRAREQRLRLVSNGDDATT